MSGKSNVDDSSLHEAGDQRNRPDSEIIAEERERFNEGTKNSHDNLDSKDERSIANRLAAEERRKEDDDDFETKLLKKDPTLPAKAHGNKPSRGAEIDAELAAEDEKRIREKDGK